MSSTTYEDSFGHEHEDVHLPVQEASREQVAATSGLTGPAGATDHGPSTAWRGRR